MTRMRREWMRVREERDGWRNQYSGVDCFVCIFFFLLMSSDFRAELTAALLVPPSPRIPLDSSLLACGNK